MVTSQFDNYLRDDELDKAYDEFMLLKKNKGKSKEVLEQSKRLSSALRRKCQELANQRAEREAIRYEKLLKEVIKFNGETLHK
jgi:Skp family chaperone for outer membrane proteins